MHAAAIEGRFEDIFFTTTGSGRPVLALHGFGATSYTWRHLVPALSERFTVWTPDLKGHGRSACPKDGKYALADHADQLLRLIQAYDLRDLALIGNSMGGGIALLIAMRLQGSGRLRSLALVDSIAYDQRIPLFARILRTPILAGIVLSIMPASFSTEFALKTAYFDDSRITRDAIEAYAVNLRDRDRIDAIIETARGLIPDDIDAITAGYKAISVPTLALWGRQDELVPLEIGERLARDIPVAELQVIDACGHIPQEEKPEEAIARIDAFLGA